MELHRDAFIGSTGDEMEWNNPGTDDAIFTAQLYDEIVEVACATGDAGNCAEAMRIREQARQNTQWNDDLNAGVRKWGGSLHECGYGKMWSSTATRCVYQDPVFAKGRPGDLEQLQAIAKHALPDCPSFVANLAETVGYGDLARAAYYDARDADNTPNGLYGRAFATSFNAHVLGGTLQVWGSSNGSVILQVLGKGIGKATGFIPTGVDAYCTLAG